MVDKNIIKSSAVENKTLTYEKNTVKFNFTFRVDIKQEMKDTLDILNQAIVDIKAILDTR